MMHIEINDGHAFKTVMFKGMGNGHGNTVKNTKAHRPTAFRVVPRRPDIAKGGANLAGDHAIGGKHTGTGGAQRRLQAIRAHRRVRIEMNNAAARHLFFNAIDIPGLVHALELLARGQRRLKVHEMVANANRNQLILHRRQALRTLRVHRPHIVQLAIRMRDKCGIQCSPLKSRPDLSEQPAPCPSLKPPAVLVVNRRAPSPRFDRNLRHTGTIATMHSKQIDHVIQQISQVILGKERQIRLAVACLLARGHLLIEDIPGVGKTTLAHTLAAVLGLQFQRIQFTSDLLPADILGVSIYERDNSRFRFHPGPIFSQVILADEVNRATPKTQSALLEAMEEHQVTAEGETRPLPEPFFVIATQNPSNQIGTFPLPESQLDRFLMRIELGYPDGAAERALLQGVDRRDLLPKLTAALQPAELSTLQAAARAVHVSSALLDYLQALVDYSRRSPDFVSGLSPRAALAMLAAARAWALMEGRNQVLPEDLQAILPGVVGHRLFVARDSTRVNGNAVSDQLIEAVPVP